jgi:hypothetical protein
LQDRPVHPLHVAYHERRERGDARLLDLLFESNDDAHVNSSAPSIAAQKTADVRSAATRSETRVKLGPIWVGRPRESMIGGVAGYL